MSSRLRIIISGLVARHPVGGMAWHYLQYVLGLARLGHHVCYHEDTRTWPYDPVKQTNSDDGNYSARFISEFFRQYAPDLSNHWHYRHLDRESFGMSPADFDQAARQADLFLNVSGSNFVPENLGSSCVKAFIDTDPGYNQVRLAENHSWWERVSAYDVLFTFAQNIGQPDCSVPMLGRPWQPTRMPIVLDCWHDLADTTPAGAPWTTIMSWNVFKEPVVHAGVAYQDKRSEFARILRVPEHAGVPMKIAVGGEQAPVAELERHRWTVIDAPAATREASDYREFIRASRGELSIAKQIYVAMKTGWFSDRSACYLASGRPVVLQDTGFSRFLPTGLGLLTFHSAEEAVAAINNVEADYAAHAAMARQIAHDHFDSDQILVDLINVAMARQ